MQWLPLCTLILQGNPGDQGQAALFPSVKNLHNAHWRVTFSNSASGGSLECSCRRKEMNSIEEPNSEAGIVAWGPGLTAGILAV